RGQARSPRQGAQEQPAGRRRPRAGRQPPARAGENGRIGRVRVAARQAGRECRHAGDRRVAEEDALGRALRAARDYAATRHARPVGRETALADLRAALDGPLPDTPIDPAAVIDHLARTVDPGIVTTTGPRYFGFVTGGALPAAAAAEWLNAIWDQNAGLYVM